MRKLFGLLVVAILLMVSCKDADLVSIEMTSYEGKISEFDNSGNTVTAKIVITEKSEVFFIEIPFQSQDCSFYTILLKNRKFDSEANAHYKVSGEVSADYSYIDLTVTRKSDNTSKIAKLNEIIEPYMIKDFQN